MNVSKQSIISDMDANNYNAIHNATMFHNVLYMKINNLVTLFIAMCSIKLTECRTLEIFIVLVTTALKKHISS